MKLGNNSLRFRWLKYGNQPMIVHKYEVRQGKERQLLFIKSMEFSQ